MPPVDPDHVHMTHPSLRDGKSLCAVPKEVSLSLCVAPSI